METGPGAGLSRGPRGRCCVEHTLCPASPPDSGLEAAAPAAQRPGQAEERPPSSRVARESFLFQPVTSPNLQPWRQATPSLRMKKLRPGRGGPPRLLMAAGSSQPLVPVWFSPSW